MSKFAYSTRVCLASSLVWLVSAAHAQTAVPSTLPTLPTPSTIPTPSTSLASYPSAFADYKPFSDEPIGNWKAANDEVARIGGWREYAKQAQSSENTPAVKAGDVKPKATP